MLARIKNRSILDLALKLLIATTNPGKVAEFRQMLGDLHLESSDLSQHPRLEPPEETGETFEANAQLKAIYYATKFEVLTLADDSGLSVDALGGKPGVHSARWAEMNHAGKGDAANNALLLQQLRDLPSEKRNARFVCALALANAAGDILTTIRGEVEGQVLPEPRGEKGFGYDPLFLVPSLGLTTAQLPPEQKHRLSHRGQALRQLHELIESGKVVIA